MNHHLRKKMLIAAFLDLSYKKMSYIFKSGRLKTLICITLTMTLTIGSVSAITTVEHVSSAASEPAAVMVKGKVVDETGETLIGVGVKEKGTSNITVTNNDGNFTLKLKSENPILIFSYIGYASQEIEGSSASIFCLDFELTFAHKIFRKFKCFQTE